MERHILIVDDEENILNALERLLSEEDSLVVHRANSGTEGLAILAAQPDIGVILSDQRMPAMTGTEFLRIVRDEYSHIVRIVLSGYAELGAITQAINEGSIFKFVGKPWDEDQLLTIITEAFEYFELSERNRLLTQALKESNQQLSRFNGRLEDLIEEQSHILQMHISFLTFYQDAVEQLPVCLLGIDEAGTIVLENRAARKRFTAQQASLLGQSYQTALATAWRPVVEATQSFINHPEQSQHAVTVAGIEVTIYRMHCKNGAAGIFVMAPAPAPEETNNGFERLQATAAGSSH